MRCSILQLNFELCLGELFAFHYYAYLCDVSSGYWVCVVSSLVGKAWRPTWQRVCLYQLKTKVSRFAITLSFFVAFHICSSLVVVSLPSYMTSFLDKYCVVSSLHPKKRLTFHLAESVSVSTENDRWKKGPEVCNHIVNFLLPSISVRVSRLSLAFFCPFTNNCFCTIF